MTPKPPASLLTKSERSNVLVVGPVEVDRTAFDERRLYLDPRTLDDINDDVLSNARGIIISDFPGKYRLTEEYFANLFERVSALGLRTAVQVRGNIDIAQVSKVKDSAYACLIERACKRLNLREAQVTNADVESDYVRIGLDLVGVAEDFARYNSGPQLGTPTIKLLDSKTSLGSETELLLKRAFWDCATIALEPLTGGKTAKDTFRVHATLAAYQFGRQPMPFFFKRGSRKYFEDEKINYLSWAEPFIPFYLRPAFNEARSVTTLTDGALVANFVEAGTPIREAMRSGQGTVGIFSLFEVTLRGLRGHAMQSKRDIGFADKFLARTRVAEIPVERIERARRLTLRTDIHELERALVERAKMLEGQHGMYHGDLHVGNVMVRQRDAIVIDFGSMEDGPLTVDSAVLEVSLVFGTDKSDAPDSFPEWRALVDDMFINNSPLTPPALTSEHARLAWLRKAVRELRHIASCCGSSVAERNLILAAALLRFGRLAPFELEDALLDLSEEKRAYALVVAEHICAQTYDATQ